MKLNNYLKCALLLIAMLLCIPGVGQVKAETSSSSSYDSSSPVCEQVVTREEKAAETARTTTQIISTRVMNVFAPSPKVSTSTSGVNSGDAFGELGMGVWALGAYSETYVNKSGYRSDSDVGIAMMGVDKLLLDDKLAVGIAAGYENTWSKITATGYKEDGSGYSVSPYAAYRVNDAFTVKGMFSATFTDYDANANNPDYSGTRLVGDVSGEYAWRIAGFITSFEAGFMYMNEDYNHNIEDTYLGEGRLSGRVSYAFDNGFEPYFRGTFYQELINNNRAHMEDHLWEGALGLNYYIGSFAISAEGYGAANEDKNNVGGSLLVRFDF
ncbi:autotransporter outer membrane beta-barrel domain-containing protein [Maridesulfovibrio sp.]|uniref:autotransporter outer membrane beta-barrel domain-containing protein n=1 Tax=Maridesulfovibrio sp. TaxID=2795000 RepID=UPI0029C9EB08|nr:autotransporter outer membrane beta-barrel domain-containing protein [Maridesulfovibrio sp.]